jgi:hypothetical protein
VHHIQTVTNQLIRCLLKGLKGQCPEFFALGFFHDSSVPKPLKNNIKIISKTRGDICKSRCTTRGATTQVGYFATGRAGVVEKYQTADTTASY